MNRSVHEHFWSKVATGPLDECWEWRASRRGEGYGGFKMNGRVVFAHRAAWELTRGEIPNGLFALHRCDNRLCCNPGHLFLGTIQDNTDDMFAKGRDRKPRGEEHGCAMLTEETVLEIRRRYALGFDSHRTLANDFGVTKTQIYRILARKSWNHI